jgi:hypothetical protein
MAVPENLSDFKDSFSYGSRSDLTFKFLTRLDPEEAGLFFGDLLERCGAVLDDGDPSELIDLVIDAQAAAYATRVLPDRYHYDTAPFTSPDRPVADSTVAMITSSGHFVAGDDPRPFGVEGMTQQEAERRIDDFLKTEPELSSIPIDTPPEATRVRHGGYDIRGSAADRNVSLPVDRMVELEADGVIGRLLPEVFSFVGAAAQGRILRSAGPAWAEMLVEQDTDVALLVPV